MDEAQKAAEWLRQHTTHGIGYSCIEYQALMQTPGAKRGERSVQRVWNWRWRGMDTDKPRTTDEELIEACREMGYTPTP